MDPIPWKQAPQPKQAALQNIPYKKMPRSMARSIEEKRAKKARTDKANQPMEPMVIDQPMASDLKTNGAGAHGANGHAFPPVPPALMPLKVKAPPPEILHELAVRQHKKLREQEKQLQHQQEKLEAQRTDAEHLRKLQHHLQKMLVGDVPLQLQQEKKETELQEMTTQLQEMMTQLQEMFPKLQKMIPKLKEMTMQLQEMMQLQ